MTYSFLNPGIWILTVRLIQLHYFLIIYCFFTPLHALTLGKIEVIDPLVGKRLLVYEEKSEFALVEGDIILTTLEALRRHSALIKVKLGGTRWPDGIIPFSIGEELPFKNKLAALAAIDHWQSHTNVQFIELSDKNRSYYKDYILFTKANDNTCSSYVGRQGGKQQINLSPRCTTMITVHELGHTLGLWHEQSRGDRSSYIQILWENIKPDHEYNFSQHLSDGQDLGEYDYQSIMHYNAYAFSRNGKKTILTLQEDAEIGQREHVSEKDIMAINTMYPK